MTRVDRKAGYREGACGRRRSGPDRKRRGEEGLVRKSPPAASFQAVLVRLCLFIVPFPLDPRVDRRLPRSFRCRYIPPRFVNA